MKLKRLLNISKERQFILCLLFMLIVSIVYFYLDYLQETFKSAQWSEKRCLSELTSVKYQLHVVTEYKSQMDKLLTESQKAHQFDKEMFKDIIESCTAMKQQSVICQSQFEDLQSECKKVREDYNKIIKKSEKGIEV